MRDSSSSVHYQLRMGARQNPRAGGGDRSRRYGPSGLTPVDSEPMRAPAVVILGGEMVVGEALELLLECADYSVRFVAEPSLELGLLDRVRLLIFTPGLNAKEIDAILAQVESLSPTTTLSVLELVNDPEEAEIGSNRLVPWPCRIRDLERHIEAALHTGSGADHNSVNPQTR